MEIERGDTRYIQLPEDHPIKKFCTAHGIADRSMQDALVDLVMESIRSAIEAMVLGSLNALDEAVKEHELLQPTEEGGDLFDE